MSWAIRFADSSCHQETMQVEAGKLLRSKMYVAASLSLNLLFNLDATSFPGFEVEKMFQVISPWFRSHYVLSVTAAMLSGKLLNVCKARHQRVLGKKKSAHIREKKPQNIYCKLNGNCFHHNGNNIHVWVQTLCSCNCFIPTLKTIRGYSDVTYWQQK